MENQRCQNFDIINILDTLYNQYYMIIPFAVSAFIAGLVTFFAPCTFPLVPGYLGFISGVSLQELNNSAKGKQERKKIFINTCYFVIGFSWSIE